MIKLDPQCFPCYPDLGYFPTQNAVPFFFCHFPRCKLLSESACFIHMPSLVMTSRSLCCIVCQKTVWVTILERCCWKHCLTAEHWNKYSKIKKMNTVTFSHTVSYAFTWYWPKTKPTTLQSMQQYITHNAGCSMLDSDILLMFSLSRNNLGHSFAAVLSQVLPCLSELSELE